MWVAVMHVGSLWWCWAEQWPARVRERSHWGPCHWKGGRWAEGGGGSRGSEGYVILHVFYPFWGLCLYSDDTPFVLCYCCQQGVDVSEPLQLCHRSQLQPPSTIFKSCSHTSPTHRRDVPWVLTSQHFRYRSQWFSQQFGKALFTTQGEISQDGRWKPNYKLPCREIFQTKILSKNLFSMGHTRLEAVLKYVISLTCQHWRFLITPGTELNFLIGLRISHGKHEEDMLGQSEVIIDICL